MHTHKHTLPADERRTAEGAGRLRQINSFLYLSLSLSLLHFLSFPPASTSRPVLILEREEGATVAAVTAAAPADCPNQVWSQQQPDNRISGLLVGVQPEDKTRRRSKFFEDQHVGTSATIAAKEKQLIMSLRLSLSLGSSCSPHPSRVPPRLPPSSPASPGVANAAVEARKNESRGLRGKYFLGGCRTELESRLLFPQTYLVAVSQTH